MAVHNTSFNVKRNLESITTGKRANKIRGGATGGRGDRLLLFARTGVTEKEKNNLKKRKRRKRQRRKGKAKEKEKEKRRGGGRHIFDPYNKSTASWRPYFGVCQHLDTHIMHI